MDTFVASVEQCWLGTWLGPSLVEFGSHGMRVLGLMDDEGDGSLKRSPAQVHIPGTLLPGLVDAHVHLGLVDPSEVVRGGIAVVHDLGWEPVSIRRWKHEAGRSVELPEVLMAGAFLAPPGGYPGGRDWAPAGSVDCIATVEDIPDAVERQITAGADHIKVTLNAQAGPVFDEAFLNRIVAVAHDRGRKVVAHAEGSGQAAKAFAAGVDVLAHAPWTERLDEGLLQAMAGSMSWISTLDIHGWGNYGCDFETAQENIRRFHAAGGRVSYGTDMGNGATITGINTRELQALQDAGLGPGELLAAMLPSNATAPAGQRFSWHPAADIPGPGEMATWLAGVTVVHSTQIKEKFS